jgi:hypothetical protein
MKNFEPKVISCWLSFVFHFVGLSCGLESRAACRASSWGEVETLTSLQNSEFAYGTLHRHCHHSSPTTAPLSQPPRAMPPLTRSNLHN